MRRITLVALAAVLVLGLAGCGGKEKEELRQKVANLEQQLAKATSQVAEREAAMASMDTSLKQAQDETAKCKVERDKLKADIAQLNKKKTATKKK
jgi:septal ring factor EnvC (AmiA/AmiB activator)